MNLLNARDYLSPVRMGQSVRIAAVACISVALGTDDPRLAEMITLGEEMTLTSDCAIVTLELDPEIADQSDRIASMLMGSLAVGQVKGGPPSGEKTVLRVWLV